jgi:PAS domain S-box-containing protein
VNDRRRPAADEGGGSVADAHLRRNEERLRLALAAGRLGIWEWDRNTDRVTWDDRMEAMFGLEPGTFGGTWSEYLALVHPDDRMAVSGAFTDPGDDADRDLRHRVLSGDGAVRWIEGRGHALRDEHGTVTGIIGVATDATERHRAEERARFLAEVTDAMGESLDVRVRLGHLVHLTVPRLADACIVHLVDDGRPRVAASHHVDPVAAEALRDLAPRFDVRLDAEVGVGAVLREGRRQHVESIDDDLLVQMATSPEHLRALRRLAPRSGISVPLIGRGRPVGAVTFLTTGERVLTDVEITLVGEVCDRAGVAIENAMLVEARARTEEQLRFQAALLEAQNEAGIEGVLVVDPQGQVLSSNRRFAEIWGFDPGVTGSHDDDLLEAAATRVVDPDQFVASVRRAYADHEGGTLDEVRMRDGRVVARYGAPLHGTDGERFGWAWYFRDVTAERLHQAELAAVGERFAALARTLQQSLLPPTLPSFPGVDLAARYHPAFEGIEVGGDFYDVFAVADAWMLVMGDVCGKGADAAALTALARYTIRAAAMHAPGPAEVLAELNAAMLANRSSADDGRFVTVCCARIEQEPGALLATVASGGHTPPLVLRADGTTEDAGRPGTLIGLFDEVDLPSATVRLLPGDALVTVTDGVMEARDGGGTQLDELDLSAFFRGLADQPAAEIATALEQKALAHQAGVARDDMAVLVARVLPGS